MTPDDFRKRTQKLAIDVVRLVGQLPSTIVCRAIGTQLVRSAGSVAANYRVACRGRSKAEFIAKLGIVEEESDECALWCDLLAESGEPVPVRRLRELGGKAEEILAMTVTTIRTARGR
jgi:four helix bundle protein